MKLLPENFVGKKYNKITVEKFLRQEGSKKIVIGRCDCGNTKEFDLHRLRGNFTKSCGCLIGANLKTHGFTGHRIYHIYKHMKARCYTKTNKDYKDYGGRGIKVCDMWLDNFKNFHNWAMENGYKNNLSIDRINVNGDYTPENCKWSNDKDQANNKRNNRKITYKGVTKNITQWAREFSVDRKTIAYRLENGWTIEDAIETPPYGGYYK